MAIKKYRSSRQTFLAIAKKFLPANEWEREHRGICDALYAMCENRRITVRMRERCITLLQETFGTYETEWSEHTRVGYWWSGQNLWDGNHDGENYVYPSNEARMLACLLLAQGVTAK